MSLEEEVYGQLTPVLENPFSSNELQELWTSILSGFPTNSPSCSETSKNGLFPSHFRNELVFCNGSSETTRSVYSVEERKRRRRISNCESARRSRWRKKKQLEDLTNEMDRLKQENRELKNQLCVLRHQYHAVQRDSIRLMAESNDLQHKLAGCLHQISANMQLQ